MVDTSLTLLESIRKKDDEHAWHVLNRLYRPLIRDWLNRFGLPAADQDDVVQEVLVQVVRHVDGFERQDQTGSFRNWLRKLTLNCMRNFVRKRGNRGLGQGGSDFEHLLQQCEDPRSELSRLWNQQHDQAIVSYLMSVVRPRFQEHTWQAFVETAVHGRPASDVASQLHMSSGAVHTAKSRVLAEMRRIGEGLLNEEAGFSSTE